MYLSLVIVLVAVVGCVTSSSQFDHNKSQIIDFNLENNNLGLELQCENRKLPKIDGSEYLKYTSIVYGILESVQNGQVGASCVTDAKRIIDGVKQRETWAIKVLDASGNKGAGFMVGNTHWLGSKITCDSIELGYKITMSDRFQRNTVPDLLATNAPILVQFRMVHAKHSSPWQVDMQFLEEHMLHIGLCLPRSCSNLDVQTMTQNYFRNSTASAQLESLNLNANVVQVKDLILRERFVYKWSVILFLLVTTVCVTLAGIAHCIDVPVEEENCSKDLAPPSDQTSIIKRLVLHFSPKRNLAYIYDTTKTSRSIPILCGLKSISCFIILVYHIQWFGFFAMKNKTDMFRLSEELANQWIANGPLLVDLFFVISGFLLSFNFLKNSQQMEQIRTEGVGANVKRFGRMVLQRYLRLVPLYFMIVLSVEISFSYLADTSNFYMQDKSDLNCQRYWWRNVLFIQNFYNFNDMCLCWSWSLACELQYFILFLFVLFAFAKNHKLGLTIFFALATTLFLITLNITLELKFMPSLDILIATGNELYINPFTRMAPYFPGVAGGWVYVMFKDKPSRLSRRTLGRIAIFSSLFILLTMHSSLKRDGDYRIAATIFVVGRWVYSTSIVSLILSNMLGYQSFLTRLLSAEFFVHISKLEYAIYLLNAMVVTVVFGTPNTSLSMDHPTIIAGGLAVTTITYALAVVYTMLFELPFSKLIGEMFAKKFSTRHLHGSCTNNKSEM